MVPQRQTRYLGFHCPRRKISWTRGTFHWSLGLACTWSALWSRQSSSPRCWFHRIWHCRTWGINLGMPMAVGAQRGHTNTFSYWFTNFGLTGDRMHWLLWHWDLLSMLSRSFPGIGNGPAWWCSSSWAHSRPYSRAFQWHGGLVSEEGEREELLLPTAEDFHGRVASTSSSSMDFLQLQWWPSSEMHWGTSCLCALSATWSQARAEGWHGLPQSTTSSFEFDFEFLHCQYCFDVQWILGSCR